MILIQVLFYDSILIRFRNFRDLIHNMCDVVKKNRGIRNVNVIDIKLLRLNV